MSASVSLPTLLGRSFRPSKAFLVIELNLASIPRRRWSINGTVTDRCHCPSNVDHLRSRLVDLAVLRICNLSDVDNENMLCRTLERLTGAYGEPKHALVHLECNHEMRA